MFSLAFACPAALAHLPPPPQTERETIQAERDRRADERRPAARDGERFFPAPFPQWTSA